MWKSSKIELKDTKEVNDKEILSKFSASPVTQSHIHDHHNLLIIISNTVIY